MTVSGRLLWPYFLASPPPEQPTKSPFLEAAVLGSSSSRKPSWTSVELVVLHSLSLLNLCPICVGLSNSECVPMSLFLILSGPTISSGQGVEAEVTGMQGEGGGEAGIVNIAGPSCYSLLSLMEKLRLHTRSLLPRSHGDADLTGPPDQKKGGCTPAMCPGQQRKSDTCLGVFLSIFILKEKKKKQQC